MIDKLEHDSNLTMHYFNQINTRLRVDHLKYLFKTNECLVDPRYSYMTSVYDKILDITLCNLED